MDDLEQKVRLPKHFIHENANIKTLLIKSHGN
jgi:hypothetical protein